MSRIKSNMMNIRINISYLHCVFLYSFVSFTSFARANDAGVVSSVAVLSESEQCGRVFGASMPHLNDVIPSNAIQRPGVDQEVGEQKRSKKSLFDEAMAERRLDRGYQIDQFAVANRTEDGMNTFGRSTKFDLNGAFLSEDLILYRLSKKGNLLSFKIHNSLLAPYSLHKRMITWQKDDTQFIIKSFRKFSIFDGTNGKLKGVVQPKYRDFEYVHEVEQIDADHFVVSLLDSGREYIGVLIGCNAQGDVLWERSDLLMSSRSGGRLQRVGNNQNLFVNANDGIHEFDPISGKDEDFFPLKSSADDFVVNSQFILARDRRTISFIEMSTKKVSVFEAPSRVEGMGLVPNSAIAYFISAQYSVEKRSYTIYKWNFHQLSPPLGSTTNYGNDRGTFEKFSMDSQGRFTIVDSKSYRLFDQDGNTLDDQKSSTLSSPIWNDLFDRWILFKWSHPSNPSQILFPKRNAMGDAPGQ